MSHRPNLSPGSHSFTVSSTIYNENIAMEIDLATASARRQIQEAIDAHHEPVEVEERDVTITVVPTSKDAILVLAVTIMYSTDPSRFSLYG